MIPAELRDVRALTFDCYGTLIDWDGGIAGAIRELPSLQAVDVDALVRRRGEIEKQVQRGPYVPYGEVLRRTLHEAAAEVGVACPAAELDAFAASMARWPPFEDSREALKRLAERYSLVILSNVERHVLEASVALLDAPFEHLVTAEDVRSYKPRAAHFEEGLRRLDLSRDEVLHVACSLYHDVEPAREHGWKTLWVNRTQEPVPASLEEPPASAVLPTMAAAATSLLGG